MNSPGHEGASVTATSPAGPALLEPIQIAPVSRRAEREAFIRLPWTLYAGDPAWVPPLLFERRRHLSPATNPSLAAMDHRLWLARQKGRVVGRISAQINHAHLARHDDRTGHFGFLEAIDSGPVVTALLDTAESWLRSRGMARSAGPYNFSVNDECGLLVDGFDTPPSLMMPHGQPYYERMVEGAGYTKAKDLIAYRFDLAKPTVPDRLRGLMDRIARDPSVALRGLRRSAYMDDVKTILDIFNDAWSENWGFVPFSEPEIVHMAHELKPLIQSDALSIAELDGEPVAFALAMPNLNEAISGLNGRLFPVGWARLLYRLKVRGVRTGRVPLLGLRKSLRGTPVGAALTLAVIEAVHGAQVRRGMETAELSWILEDNTSMRAILDEIGAEPYKTYRIYARDL